MAKQTKKSTAAMLFAAIRENVDAMYADRIDFATFSEVQHKVWNEARYFGVEGIVHKMMLSAEKAQTA